MTSKLRKQMREAAGNRCEACRSTAHRLHVHHKDRDRKNDDPSNLQVLCQPCHWHVHQGHEWSEELGDWDTEWNREQYARERRWREGAKETAIVTFDAGVLAFLRLIATQQFGSEDVGRLISCGYLRGGLDPLELRAIPA